jgi:hypothetical protein
MFADFGGALLGDGGGLRVLNFSFIWPLTLEDGISELFLLRSP